MPRKRHQRPAREAEEVDGPQVGVEEQHCAHRRPPTPLLHHAVQDAAQALPGQREAGQGRAVLAPGRQRLRREGQREVPVPGDLALPELHGRDHLLA
eukprot:9304218-Lingulodinium_polyedra.AAC.1